MRADCLLMPTPGTTSAIRNSEKAWFGRVSSSMIPERSTFTFGQQNSGTLQLLARALYQIGFLVLMLAPHQQEDGSAVWNVEAGVREPISRIVSPDFTERMVRLAAEHSSEYDGWGTSL